MSYCYKCGNEVDRSTGFCPKCGASLSAAKSKGATDHTMLKGILALLTLGGFAVGAFLLVGGLIAVIMDPVVESTPAGGRVWAIGLIVWELFYMTGLIDYCLVAGLVCIGVGIGSYALGEALDR